MKDKGTAANGPLSPSGKAAAAASTTATVIPRSDEMPAVSPLVLTRVWEASQYLTPLAKGYVLKVWRSPSSSIAPCYTPGHTSFCVSLAVSSLLRPASFPFRTDSMPSQSILSSLERYQSMEHGESSAVERWSWGDRAAQEILWHLTEHANFLTEECPDSLLAASAERYHEHIDDFMVNAEGDGGGEGAVLADVGEEGKTEGRDNGWATMMEPPTAASSQPPDGIEDDLLGLSFEPQSMAKATAAATETKDADIDIFAAAFDAPPPPAPAPAAASTANAFDLFDGTAAASAKASDSLFPGPRASSFVSFERVVEVLSGFARGGDATVRFLALMGLVRIGIRSTSRGRRLVQEQLERLLAGNPDLHQSTTQHPFRDSVASAAVSIVQSSAVPVPGGLAPVVQDAGKLRQQPLLGVHLAL